MSQLTQTVAAHAEPARSSSVLWPSLRLLVLLSVVLGLGYPLAVTGLAQLLMPAAANGSLIQQNGKTVGSALIGQSFNKPGEFWGRPSATGGSAYNAAGSGGSNLGPSNPALAKAVAERIAALKAVGPVPAGAVPADLVTASASGLDPHISLAAALYQVPRIAKATGRSESQLRALVMSSVQTSWFGNADSSYVNVLALNLALQSR